MRITSTRLQGSVAILTRGCVRLFLSGRGDRGAGEGDEGGRRIVGGGGGRRGSCTFSGRTLGFPRTRFSLPLFFFFALFLSPPPSPSRRHFFRLSLALSESSSLVPSSSDRKRGEKGRGGGRRALIRADGVSFHEYWPSTVSLAPYRFARDIARVLCRSLVRSSARSLARSFIRSVRSRSPRRCSLARLRNPRSNGRLRNRSPSVPRRTEYRVSFSPFRSFLAADVTRADYRGGLFIADYGPCTPSASTTPGIYSSSRRVKFSCIILLFF